MHPLHDHPILTLRRQIEQFPSSEFAWYAIDEFYNFYNDETANDELWFIICTALTVDDEVADNVRRSNMLYFYEYMLTLYKAIGVLYQWRLEKEKKKKSKKKK